MSLRPDIACVLFSILTSLLKNLKGILSTLLQRLFHCSFSIGLMPDQFKMAEVDPVHKKRKKKN